MAASDKLTAREPDPLVEEIQNVLDSALKAAVDKKDSRTQQAFVAVHHGAIIPRPGDCDIVFQNIYIGGEFMARDKEWLIDNKITHVVNTAQGKRFGQVDTDESYYAGGGIKYFGIPGHDSVKFDISKHFQESADFIKEGNQSGKVYVHCHQGISRSTTIVIAYMMTHHSMTAVQALSHILQHRMVMPNRGFIKRLAAYQKTLTFQTAGS